MAGATVPMGASIMGGAAAIASAAGMAPARGAGLMAAWGAAAQAYNPRSSEERRPQRRQENFRVGSMT